MDRCGLGEWWDDLDRKYGSYDNTTFADNYNYNVTFTADEWDDDF